MNEKILNKTFYEKMHFTEFFISVPILALYSTREITSNLSSAKMATKRFASHTESEINHKKANLVPKNTSKANARAARLFKSYLTDKNEESEFELFDIHRLAQTLIFIST